MTLYTNHLVRNIYGDIDYTQQEKFENITIIEMTRHTSQRKGYYWLEIITIEEEQYSIEMSTKDDTWWIEN